MAFCLGRKRNGEHAVLCWTADSARTHLLFVCELRERMRAIHPCLATRCTFVCFRVFQPQPSCYHPFSFRFQLSDLLFKIEKFLLFFLVTPVGRNRAFRCPAFFDLLCSFLLHLNHHPKISSRHRFSVGWMWLAPKFVAVNAELSWPVIKRTPVAPHPVTSLAIYEPLATFRLP